MGYMTDHTFEEPLSEEQVEALENITGYSHEEGGDLYDAKWYEHQENMKEFSKLYPDQLFQLNGEGEESGDIWREFYKNGKSFFQQPKIVYEEFKESDLK